MIEVLDLAGVICDFCDDATLLKLSMVSRQMRVMLTDDSSDRQVKKGYHVRILKYKYRVAATKLDRVSHRMKKGELVDLVKLRAENKKAK